MKCFPQWFKLYVDRIGEFNRRKLTPEKIKKGEQTFEDVQSSDHFKNLFEVPVLFYTLCGALAVTKADSDLQYGDASPAMGSTEAPGLRCCLNKISAAPRASRASADPGSPNARALVHEVHSPCWA